MTIKPGIREFLWMSAGAVMLLLVMLVIMHFRMRQSPAEQSALKAVRLELVSRIRLSLASASEAEKSAVMAVTDEDSRTFANQARAYTADAEKGREELEKLLASGGTRTEKELLVQFSADFTEFRRIDKELLALAVKNTNIKAYGLAFGPATSALNGMATALSRLAEKNAGGADAAKVAMLAFGAQTAALRIQTLLAPHIAEESDSKMDELEALMAADDREVRNDIKGLAAIRGLDGAADLRTAEAGYAMFGKIRAQIIELSRENTNVKSLAISLSQKRKEMFMCQDSLSALQRAILDEPIADVSSSHISNPRNLGIEK